MLGRIICACGIMLLAVTALTVHAGPIQAKDVEGKWTIVEVEQEGKKMPCSFKVVISDKRISWENLSFLDSTYTIDVAKGHIDMVPVEGPNAGKIGRGIFRYKGDTLTICVADFGSERPTDFTTKQGSTGLLLTFKR